MNNFENDFANEIKKASFVGINNYKNSSNEIANFVINCGVSYKNAIAKTNDILSSLTEDDFIAIAKKYDVTNVAGTKYANNKGAEKYLNEGILPKEGTKARETALNGVKTTKSLSEIRDEMINNNNNPRPSNVDESVYTRLGKGIKKHNATNKIHIWGFIQHKTVLEEGTYTEKKMKLETAQAKAIERYCKKIGKELPKTKFRQFVCDTEHLNTISYTGNTAEFR